MNGMTRDELATYVVYNPKTGVFRWLARSPDQFTTQGRDPSHACAIWNSKNAGKDAGWVSDTGYIVVSINRVKIKAHRLAWLYVYGSMPSKAIDHINGVKTDNRIENLREATMSQNIANARKRSDNTSGSKGVSFDFNRQKWASYLTANGCRKFLGYFETKHDAAKAYSDAASAVFGNFARTA